MVDGQGGTNTLIGPDLAEGWSITGANAGGVGGINFTNVQNLTGGSGADTFTFGDGKGVTGVINGGGGTNTLDYSFYRTGVTVNLPTRTATGTGVVLNIQNVTGSPANDSITGDFASNVLNGDGGTDVLNGGSGADTFILAATQGTATTVTGFGTADTLQGANIANTWTITGANAGNVNGIAFTGIARLTGGTSTDAFKFTTGSVSGTVDGGGGTDTLDYSADGGAAVTVNLATHTATRTGGFANIEKLVGSTSAADTLVGPNAASTWSITGANAGTVGAFSFSAVENLTGGSANDTFKFAPAGSLTRQCQRRPRDQHAGLLPRRRLGRHGQPGHLDRLAHRRLCRHPGPGRQHLGRRQADRAERDQHLVDHRRPTPAPSAPSASRPSRT